MLAPQNTTASVGDILELRCRAQLSPQGTVGTNPDAQLNPNGTQIEDPDAIIPSYTEDKAKIRYFWFITHLHQQTGNGDDENQNGRQSQTGNGHLTNDSIATENQKVYAQNGDVITDGPHAPEDRMFMSENGSLFINGVLPRDQGQFTCLAKNAGGSSMVTAYIDVIGAYF